MSSIIYESSDAGAPVIAQAAGSLSAALKAILVDGYGNKPPAGWSVAFEDSGGLNRAFRTAGPPYAYLQVLDNAPGYAAYREARIAGFETMTDALNGSARFPTSAQAAVGFVVRKSSAYAAPTNPWVIAADPQRLYLFLETGDMTDVCSHTIFTRFQSAKVSDLFNWLIAGRPSENTSSMSSTYERAVLRTYSLTAYQNCYLMRSYTGIGGSTLCGIYTDSIRANTTSQVHAGSTGMAYPNPADGGLYMARSHLCESAIHRGTIPGIWTPCHIKPLGHRDTFEAVVDLVPRTFKALNCGTGQLFLETSDTWDL